VAWRSHGRLVQVMDPAVGRRWQSRRQFLDSLYIHRQAVEAAAWREWAASDEFLDLLRRNLADLGLNPGLGMTLIADALADSGWRSISGLHAVTRMPASLICTGAIRRGDHAARMIKSSFAEVRREDITQTIYRRYSPVRAINPASDGSEQVELQGAVLVRVRGVRQHEPNVRLLRRKLNHLSNWPQHLRNLRHAPAASS